MSEVNKKIITGIVVSTKMDKSIVVKEEKTIQHKLYKRTLKRSKKFMAHDEQNVCQEGDVVRIVESAPYSRHKTWRLLEVVESSSPVS